jgi:hypothetical protein
MFCTDRVFKVKPQLVFVQCLCTEALVSIIIAVRYPENYSSQKDKKKLMNNLIQVHFKTR